MKEIITFREDDRIAVVAPHPDDECIGVSAALIFAPKQTDIIVMTDGSHGNPEVEPAEGEADQQDQEVMNQIYEELAVWAGELLKDVFYISSTNAGQDGRTMRMVCLPGHAVPVLLHGVYNSDTNDLDDSCVLVYIGGTWVDLGALEDMPAEPAEDVELSEGMQAFVDRFVEGIFQAGVLNDILDLVFYRIHGGENNVLPADGLDVMQPAQSSMFKSTEEDAADIPQPKKSRPKLEPAPEALPEAEATAEPAEAAAEESVPEAIAEPTEEPAAAPAEEPAQP